MKWWQCRKHAIKIYLMNQFSKLFFKYTVYINIHVIIKTIINYVYIYLQALFLKNLNN